MNSEITTMHVLKKKNTKARSHKATRSEHTESSQGKGNKHKLKKIRFTLFLVYMYIKKNI